MTDAAAPLAVATVAVPLLGAGVLACLRTAAARTWANAVTAAATAAPALALAVVALVHGDAPARGDWFVADAAAGVFLLVVATVGLLSALASPAALRGHAGGRSPRAYYAAFHLFWAALLALPLVANLGVAWLLVEATTAASALLVASSGRRSALEAGWKYLVLTTLGLAIALLGIVVLYAALADGGGALETLGWAEIRDAAAGLDGTTATVAALLIVAGLAAKAGWAPVHNWLPDAHSEAPPPVSALLSAALLPSVMLVVWRLRLAVAPAGTTAVDAALIAFGIASLAVAVPFLWRPLPLKRLLAYSSLEHMGVIALGLGIAHPLAIAGVALHVAGHALAKSLGFYAAIPLLAADPSLARRRAVALGAASPAAAGAVGVSLAALAALPPSPLFFSELLILAGGFAAGEVAVAAVAALLLALGFVGLAHACIEAVAADRPRAVDAPAPPRRRERRTFALTAGVVVALAALAATAWALPDSQLVARLMGAAT